MIRTRHRILACMAAVVAMAVAAEASAASLLVLSYSQAKTFGAVHVAGGAIDLTNGSMIVTTSSFGFVPSGGQANEYGSPGVAEFGDAAIHDALAEGANYQNGFWNGTNGLYSSAAANDPNGITAVGWVDNSVTQYTIFNGVALTTNQSIIGATWYGDSLMAGLTTPDDYTIWAGTMTNPSGPNVSAFTGGPVEWIDGSWDQNTPVTPNDYTIWAGSMTSPGMHNLFFNPSAPSAGAGAGAAAVPEPGTIGLILVTISAALLGSRRWRKQKVLLG